MSGVKQQFVVDDEGRKVAVLLDIDEYHALLDALEETETARAYDAAKASGDPSVPFDEAVAMLNRRPASALSS